MTALDELPWEPSQFAKADGSEIYPVRALIKNYVVWRHVSGEHYCIQYLPEFRWLKDAGSSLSSHHDLSPLVTQCYVNEILRGVTP
jgi:hypothetical protein